MGNAKKEGVKTTKSGLQYQMISEGKGPQPKLTDKVKVHYTGTLLNGTEFDSSHRKGKPQEFGLTQMIPGFSEGVRLMKVGSKYKFFIPANLAYGSRGAGAIVGSNAVLVFEIELLDILKQPGKTK